MTEPKWLSDIRERAEAITAHAKRFKYSLNQESVLRNRIALEHEGTDQEYCDIYANSTVDIPRLLQALDRYREALKLFSCNTPPDEVRVWNDGTVSDCCKATAALNFDPTGEG